VAFRSRSAYKGPNNGKQCALNLELLRGALGLVINTPSPIHSPASQLLISALHDCGKE
jgi:hypothetical protein